MSENKAEKFRIRINSQRVLAKRQSVSVKRIGF